jgi:hypothetical protein
MCAAIADQVMNPAGTFISYEVGRIFQDSRRVVEISLVAYSCLAFLSLGFTASFSAAAFIAIVIKGAIGAFIANATWNIASLFFNFTVKRIYRFYTNNEQLRTIFNNNADQVHFGLSMTVYKIFSAVINGRRFAAVPLNNFNFPVFSIMRKNVVILAIITAIFWVIDSRIRRVNQSSGEFINHLVNDHLNNPNLPQQKRDEFRENMAGVSGDFFVQISQLCVLDIVSSPNPLYPAFVNRFRNNLEILRRAFQALPMPEQDIIKSKIHIDRERGVLSDRARNVWDRMRNMAFNSLLQGNENFTAAVQQCVAERE